MRESAALSIIPILQRAGLHVCVHDPKAQTSAQQVLGDNLDWHDDIYKAVKGADVLVILTEWDDYRRMNLSRVADLMDGDQVFDFRNLFKPEDVMRHGLVYHSLGRAVGTVKERNTYGQGGGRPSLVEVAASPV